MGDTEKDTAGLGQPEFLFTQHGIECARWGVFADSDDLVPLVYSSPDDVEVGELRMDFATADALILRLQTAIAYERAKAAAPSAAAARDEAGSVTGATYGPINECPKGIAPPHDTYADPSPTSATYKDALLESLAGVELGAYDHRIVLWLAGWDTSTVAVFVSLLHRARRAGSGA